MADLDELALALPQATKEIAEVMFQMITYGGAPATVQSLRVLREALKERGEWSDADDLPK